MTSSLQSPPASNQYLLGQTIVFEGTVQFADQEEAGISKVRLVNVGNSPQPLNVQLPVASTGGVFIDFSEVVPGTLLVKATFIDVDGIVVGGSSLGGSLGSSLGGSLGGQNLAGSGDFKGVSSSAKIEYVIQYTPPVFLDPAPNFTLIPSTDDVFAIPLLSTPSAAAGTKLPDVDQKFVIPTVGAPTFAAVLPNASSTFNIPTVTVSTNASTTLLNLPDTASTTGAFGFAIPAPTLDTAPGTAGTVPEFSVFVNLSGSPAIRGLTSDGTDFYVVSSGTGGGGVDEIIKVFGSSTSPTASIDTGFATSGKLDGPSSNVEGLAFVDGSLWVLENKFRCFDAVDNFRCDREHRVFEIDPSSPPSGSESSWGAVSNIINGPFAFDRIAGITSEGTGSWATLWLAHEDGFGFFNIDQSGSEVDSPFPNQFVDGMDGLAFLDDHLYTSDGDVITKWTDDGDEQQTVSAVKESDSSSISGIKGMTFKPISNKQVLFVGSDDGTVYQGFFADTAETDDPLGIAFSPSSSAIGEFLWILVDGTPFNKILKVDTSGTIQTGFGTGGAADSPTTDGEGITFLDGSLYIVANETGQFGGSDRKLYKVSPSTGAKQAEFNLGNTANIFDDLGGITNDGTNVVVYFEDFNDIAQIDPSDGSEVDRTFLCCPSSVFGANAFTRHADRNQYFAASGSSLLTIDSTLQNVVGSAQTLKVDGTALSSLSPSGVVRGMAFDTDSSDSDDGDVLYMVYKQGSVGRVSVGRLVDAVQTLPRGLAFSPDGSTLAGALIDEALWALVDGDPVDEILKIDTSNNSLITSFNGPSQETAGLTFLDGHLYIIANDTQQFGGENPTLYKVKGTDGSLVESFSLQQIVFGNMGGITNDGTDLLISLVSNQDVFVVDITGTEVETKFPSCCLQPNVNGSRASAFSSDTQQLLVGKNNDITQLDIDQLELLDEFEVVDASNSDAALVDIQGMTFDLGTADDATDDVLYIAHEDGTQGKISKAGVPSDITNNPRGLAYDPVENELYILVDGTNVDHIVVVDPSSGNVDRDFPSQDGDSHGITFLDGSLYVSVNDDGFRQIFELDPEGGDELSSFEVDFLPGDTHAGLANDGENLVVAPQFGGPHVEIIDPSSGSVVSEKFFFDPTPGQFFDEEGFGALALSTTTPKFYTAKGDLVFRFEEEGNLIEEFDIEESGFGGIQDAVFVGGLIYLAESQGDKIYAALVPSVTAVRTTNPRAMASDATSLYLVVDGEPEDQLMKLDPNSPNSPLVTSFGTGGAVDAPGTDIDAIAFHSDGFLYTLSNDLRSIDTQQGVFQFELPVLNKIEPDTGEVLAFLPILIEDFGEFFFLIDPIDALASDGVFLYGGARATAETEGVWFRIDLNDIVFIEAFGELFGGPVAEEIEEFEGQLDFMPGFQSMEVTTGSEFPENRQLLASGDVSESGFADTIARFNRDDGTMFREVIPGATNGQFRLTGKDIKGMGYATSSKL